MHAMTMGWLWWGACTMMVLDAFGVVCMQHSRRDALHKNNGMGPFRHP